MSWNSIFPIGYSLIWKLHCKALFEDQFCWQTNSRDVIINHGCDMDKALLRSMVDKVKHSCWLRWDVKLNTNASYKSSFESG